MQEPNHRPVREGAMVGPMGRLLDIRADPGAGMDSEWRVVIQNGQTMSIVTVPCPHVKPWVLTWAIDWMHAKAEIA